MLLRVDLERTIIASKIEPKERYKRARYNVEFYEYLWNGFPTFVATLRSNKQEFVSDRKARLRYESNWKHVARLIFAKEFIFLHISRRLTRSSFSTWEIGLNSDAMHKSMIL